jgi:hypothetical protein
VRIINALLRSPVVWTATALFAVFLAAAKVFPYESFLETLRVLQMTVWTVVGVAYCAEGFWAVLHGRPNNREQLILGICVGAAAYVMLGAWSLLWRLSGQPAWMFNSDINAAIITASILAGVLHVTAPGAIDGTVPKRNWIYLGVAIGGAVLISGITLSLQPSLAWIVHAIEPYFRE